MHFLLMMDPWIVQRVTRRLKLISIYHRHLSEQVECMLLHTLEHGSSTTKAARRRHGLASAGNSRGGAICISHSVRVHEALPGVVRSAVGRVLLSRSPVAVAPARARCAPPSAATPPCLGRATPPR